MRYALMVLICLAGVAATAGLSPAADIEVVSLKVTYRDDVTEPGKVVARELRSFQDDEYWSKPDKVDLSVEITNSGKEETASVRVVPELYFLLKQAGGPGYPPIREKVPDYYGRPAELKSLMEGPVWVWNRVLASRPPVKIGPGRTVSLEFRDLDINNAYYATDYEIIAFAIRIFARVREGEDPDYSNNVADHVVMYGD